MIPYCARRLAAFHRIATCLAAVAMVTASLMIAERTGVAQESASPAAFAINDFGLRLLQVLEDEKPGGNAVISPVSVALALAMTSNGSQGETHLAMATVLGITGLGDNLNPANQMLI